MHVDPAPDHLSPATIAAHAGRPDRHGGAPLNEPITLASNFHAGGPRSYARYGTPLSHAFETVIAELEEAAGAIAFSSGMAAIQAVVDLIPAGATVLTPASLYYETSQALRQRSDQGRLRIVVLDEPLGPTQLREHAAQADVLWLENPTNPLLDEVDVELAVSLMRPDALVIVDSTLATPVLRNPLRQGASIVVHSATKQIAGHSDALLGVAASDRPDLVEKLLFARGDNGAAPGSLELFLALRGARTLPLRVERAQENAAEIARRLGTHPAVSKVRWPGWGTLVSFELGGDVEAADLVTASVRLWTHATSLGDVTSLMERRRRWGGEWVGVPGDLIRLSLGVEHIDDLWRDIARALDAVLERASPRA